MDLYFDENTYSEHIIAVFAVLNQAQTEVGETLSTCYFMQTFIELVRSIDNNMLYMSISSYVDIFKFIIKTFKQLIIDTHDTLQMETVLIMIEYLQILEFFELTHDYIHSNEIVKLMIDSLEKQTHPSMIKAVAGALFSFGDRPSFND